MIVPFAPSAPPTTGWYSYLGVDATPSSIPEGDRKYDLIEGIRVEKVMGAAQVKLANDLGNELSFFLRPGHLGQSFIEMTYLLPKSGNERTPDVSFVSSARWAVDQRIPKGNGMPVAPDLAVEVISPWELTWASFAKLEEYFAEGVKQVWLVLPNVERIYCYTSPTAVRILSRGDDLTTEPLIPGFRLPVADLFGPAAEPDAGPGA